MSRKKERDYAPYEAVEAAKAELAPFWYRSEPLLCGAEVEGQVNPQPLDAKVRDGIWVFFFSYGTGPSLNRAIPVFHEWQKRYANLGVNFVYCFRSRYSFLKDRARTQVWLKERGIDSIACCDSDGLLSRAFGGEIYPRIVLLQNGGIVANQADEKWLDGTEKELHRMLRVDSPGLPLLPPLIEGPVSQRDVAQWSFYTGSPHLKNPRLTFTGMWKQEPDRMVTQDSHAEFIVDSPAAEIVLVGQSLSEDRDPTRIYFQSQGASFSGQFGGPDFSVDDEGQSGTVLSSARAYSILKDLPPASRKVTFRFPNARVNPVAIYGVEFIDPV